ncbi:MAG: CDP-alcohol phosphatidyltransferase family protein [Balneolaceae bacterium]|nr:CDP-alcohol phosphatidyltransferase family protein [Balneolaceae bacterium]
MRSIPNILSTIRLVLAPVFLLLYLQDEVVWRALSLGVFAVAVVTDFFDGYIARNYKAQTSYGVFLDPLADKFLTFAGFLCLPFIDAAQFPWWAIGVIMFRDVAVTGLRMAADYRRIPMETRVTAKLKTLLQMFFLYMVLVVGLFIQTDVWLSEPALRLLQSGVLGWAMIFVVIFTLYSGIEYLVVNKEIITLNEPTKSEADNR